MSNEDVIRGLLEERAAYEKRGDKAGAKLVDEQLKFYGHEGAPKAKRSTKRTSKTKTEKR
jgi:hypothetical protein